MINKFFPTTAAMLVMTAACFLLMGAPAKAAELKPETIKAWRKAVANTEQRIETELSSKKGFLALDFLDSEEAARERKLVLSGQIPVMQVTAIEDIKVPDGMIHHWRGSVFIPGVTIDFVLNRVKNPDLEVTKQEDVLDSKVLDRTPDGLTLYLKLQKSKLVTVVYNTEHEVRYQSYGPKRESSRSIATKIAEVEFTSNKKEREKPEGQDSGFLWRMNSYWRYQQVDGGVIVECESMTLSRSVPLLLKYIVRPMISGTARESMERTLDSLRTRMVRAYKSNPETMDPGNQSLVAINTN